MATYKVTNADKPIESDYWIDYPIKDPATNLDSVDEEGHILVERHVTRSVNLASYNSILAKMPAVDANTTGLANLKTYAETNVQALNTALAGANTSITSVTKTATDTATAVSNIQKKIDTIQGIDIDEFKLVTDTNIRTNATAISDLQTNVNALGTTLSGSYVTLNTDQTITGYKTYDGLSLANTFNDNAGSTIIRGYSKAQDVSGTFLARIHINNNSFKDDPCSIHVIASDGAKVNDLTLRPSGESTVAGKHIVRSVNGVAAGADGNVSLNGGGDLMTVSTEQTIVGTKNFSSIQING